MLHQFVIQNSLYTQHKNFPSFTRGSSLPIFTANETITNLTQYELSEKETNLLKVGLYFSIQPDKLQKSEIVTTFQKFHPSFITTLNLRILEIRKRRVSRILVILISTTTDLLHVYYVNTVSYEILKKTKTSL